MTPHPPWSTPSPYDTAARAASWAERLRLPPVAPPAPPEKPDPEPVPEPIPDEEAPRMESLWRVYIVTKQRRVITTSGAVVAADEAGARFRAGVDESLRRDGLTPDDVTVVCERVADVEVEKAPQKVYLVTEPAKAPPTVEAPAPTA